MKTSACLSREAASPFLHVTFVSSKIIISLFKSLGLADRTEFTAQNSMPMIDVYRISVYARIA